MSIFSRFRDIVSSNLNAMLDGAEDPEKLVRLMIQEMEDTLIEIKAACAGAIAARKKVGRQLADAQGRASGWAAKAQLAVTRGREALAREALLEKRRAAEAAAGLERESAGLEEVVRGYQADIGQLEEKLGGAREKQRVLVQRHIRAQNQTKAQEQIRKVDTHDALLRYEQFEGRVERLEAEAELVNAGRKPSLEEQFAQLERDEDIEKELAALKQQQAAGGAKPESSSSSTTGASAPAAS